MEQREFLRKQMLKKTREQIEEKFAGKEIHIIKSINLLMDLDSINNLMSENLSEWETRNPQEEAKTQFENLKKNTTQIQEEKTKLMEFIEKEMRTEFPNFSEIATPIIGAKLLSEAGSKKKLCFMPASTIQVLGAEKALFAHLRKNAKSPKHGHLFNHPLLQTLPRFKRGKAARIIAGKLSIALKQDYFNGENTSLEVKKLLEEKIITIKNEPETPEQKQREKEYDEINFARRKEDFLKENKKREIQKENRTFTPEERKAFFSKNTSEKPWTKKTGNYSQAEENFNKRRKFGPKPNYNSKPYQRDNSQYREKTNYEPKQYNRDKPRFRRENNEPRQERRNYNNENTYPRREKKQFNSDYNSKSNFRSKEERYSRPNKHSSFGTKRFGNKSKQSFPKRTPRTAKRY